MIRFFSHQRIISLTTESFFLVEVGSSNMPWFNLFFNVDQVFEKVLFESISFLTLGLLFYVVETFVLNHSQVHPSQFSIWLLVQTNVYHIHSLLIDPTSNVLFQQI